MADTSREDQYEALLAEALRQPGIREVLEVQQIWNELQNAAMPLFAEEILPSIAFGVSSDSTTA